MDVKMKIKIREREDLMRKKYIYAITLILCSLCLWIGYYFYLEYRPVSYQNGTFVEIPSSTENKELELFG